MAEVSAVARLDTVDSSLGYNIRVAESRCVHPHKIAPIPARYINKKIAENVSVLICFALFYKFERILRKYSIIREQDIYT